LEQARRQAEGLADEVGKMLVVMMQKLKGTRK
jgi:hypothetical protein